VPVKVGRTVVPPDRAALTKGHLGAIHCRACDRDTGFVGVTQRTPTARLACISSATKTVRRSSGKAGFDLRQRRPRTTK
jgi:hypothetical protein